MAVRADRVTGRRLNRSKPAQGVTIRLDSDFIHTYFVVKADKVANN
jgi:hypothetical protein